MTIRTFILTLTVLTSNDIFSQCNNVYYRALPKLTQDTFSTITIKGDTFYVFSDSTDWNYLQSEQTPDTSKLDGTWLLLKHKNPDSILIEVTYKNGLRDGNLICRLSNRTLLENRIYKAGKQHGRQLSYHYDTGTIWQDENFKHGKKEGEQKYYDRNGQLNLYKYYIDGNLHGELKSWHVNGKLARLENYNYGQRQGAFYTWDREGRVTEYAYFIGNLPVGASFGFNAGKLTFERYFENGQLKREIYEYYTLPQKYFETKRKRKTELDFSKIEHSIKKKAVYTESTILVRTYYPSGQLKSEEPIIFVEEKDCKKIYHKTGEHKFWTEDGQLEKILVYKDDQLIETKKE